MPAASVAAMTTSQLPALAGSSLLQVTGSRLFEKCGLPASIIDLAGPEELPRRASWRGTTMRLSDADWQITYGAARRDAGTKGKGWINPDPSPPRCDSGIAWMVLQAKGRSGVLTTRKKPDGFGYDTTYRVPENLFEAHRVVGVRLGLANAIRTAELTGRYGTPDEILALPESKVRHRYWVLTRNGRRPDTLHAVDFEIDRDSRSCGAYKISAVGSDFVDEKFASLLREWERDHVLD